MYVTGNGFTQQGDAPLSASCLYLLSKHMTPTLTDSCTSNSCSCHGLLSAGCHMPPHMLVAANHMTGGTS